MSIFPIYDISIPYKSLVSLNWITASPSARVSSNFIVGLVPRISNVVCGSVVPIPTLPFPDIVNRSVPITVPPVVPV